MRICPSCGNHYPDDANFCPMDATRLSLSDPSSTDAIAVPANAVGGRFVPVGLAQATPTGDEVSARDLQEKQLVTLKLVPTTVLPTSVMVDRASRELKQLRKIQSPHIVRVIDEGRTEDGRLYVATEPTVDPTLEALVAREGALPLERACALIVQLGEALIEAQKVGVIHRDVAPRNIRLAADDRIVVTEFGLAEPLGDRVFGTAAYLSPEQVEGRPVDQRSNIYSLGAVFYFLLTGQAPFTGDLASVLHAQLTAKPEPPSRRRPGAPSEPGVPPEIDRIILKALEKSGGRRHLTLRQLLSEIEGAGRQGAEGASGGEADQTIVSLAPPSQETELLGPPTAATVLGVPSPFAPRPAASHAPSGEVVTVPPTPAVSPASVTPPPASPAASTTSTKGATGASAVKNKTAERRSFRETAWFKKGELEEELAQVQAERASPDPLAPTGTTGQQTAFDENNLQLSAQDEARLSLKTGHTNAMPALRMAESPRPSGAMDEAEMLAEINASRRRTIFIAGGIAFVLFGTIALWALHRSRGALGTAPREPSTELQAARSAGSSLASTAGRTVATSTSSPSTGGELPRRGAAEPLAVARAALEREDLPGAVDACARAASTGAELEQLKELEGTLGRAITAEAARAKRRNDRAATAKAHLLLARLHKLDGKHR